MLEVLYFNFMNILQDESCTPLFYSSIYDVVTTSITKLYRRYLNIYVLHNLSNIIK